MYTTWLRHAQQKINCLRQPIFQKQTRHLCMAQMVIALKTAQIWHPRIVLISIAHQERKTQLVWPPWYCQLDQKILHQPFRTNIVTTLKINQLPLSKFCCFVVNPICPFIIKLIESIFFNYTYSFVSIFIDRTHELLNLSNKGVRITKLTNYLKKTSDEERGSELSINEEDSVLTSKPFQTYCKQTSLHGWKYVAFSKGSKFERLCWLFLLLLALLIASNLVYR